MTAMASVAAAAKVQAPDQVARFRSTGQWTPTNRFLVQPSAARGSSSNSSCREPDRRQPQHLLQPLPSLLSRPQPVAGELLVEAVARLVISRPSTFSTCRVDLQPIRALHVLLGSTDSCCASDIAAAASAAALPSSGSAYRRCCPAVHYGWCGEVDRSAASGSAAACTRVKRSSRAADWAGAASPVNEWPAQLPAAHVYSSALMLQQQQQQQQQQQPLTLAQQQLHGRDQSIAQQVLLRDKDKAAGLLTGSSSGDSRSAARRVLSEEVPKFYFPNGRPPTAGAGEPPTVAQALQSVADVFASCEGGKMYKHQMHSLAKACGLPLYWGTLLFYACSGEKVGFITQPTFVTLWKRLCSTCFDDASKFLRLMARPGCNYLATEDFVLLIQDIVDTHPGLQFLQDAPEFHSRYIHTVISRIFYCVNRSWSGKITIPELRKSNFLQTLAILEEEDDINQVTDYFSYEHFYVIYCKFWELDKDHDLFISKEDLSRHNDHAVSSRIIDRIFSGAVTRGKHLLDGKMSYTEFVWFLLSEEDKKQPRSIEYWFRCMDMDGDGVLSMFEMEYFYEEQVQKMEDMGIEPLPFTDLICQVLDMIGPKSPNAVTLADLKNCKLASVVLNTFINLEKYLDQEQKDPFASGTRDVDGAAAQSDWEKYAAEEYEVLVAEDSGNNDAEAAYDYEDDFEPDDEYDGGGSDYENEDGGDGGNFYSSDSRRGGAAAVGERGRHMELDGVGRPATPDGASVATNAGSSVPFAKGSGSGATALRPKSARGNSSSPSSAGEPATVAYGAASVTATALALAQSPDAQ